MSQWTHSPAYPACLNTLGSIQVSTTLFTDLLRVNIAFDLLFPVGLDPKTASKLRKANVEDPEEKRWAEVAKFNQLLDKKIKLDEASEMRRKANL